MTQTQSEHTTQRDPQAMLQTMADMQAAHNAQVHPAWQSQGYAYYRAIWVECAEMLDHFGWKWWKQQNCDLDQVKLELVDIWHFALSELLRGGALVTQEAQQQVAQQLAAHSQIQASSDTPQPEAFRLAIESLAADCLASQSFNIAPFLKCMQTLPLSYDDLFDLYIGKNILNRFRQDNGYKQGSYRKLWQGREDNVHLIEALSVLDCNATELPEALYVELRARYEA